jgi:Undecaprenyl-phosphate galactose phosphotransferase WbaP
MNASIELLRLFRHVIFISDRSWFDRVSFRIHDFEGLIGVEARKNLLSPANLAVKRVLDILFSLVLSILFLPVVFLVGLLTKMDSRGPIFYQQERIGMGGRRIRVYKFRTMVENADSALKDCIEKNFENRMEWEQNHKLRDDPRITRFGRFLRKYSIDELPQLINVLKGDLSLVGPRPIVDAEVHHYCENITEYKNVRPGVTGLWQVSGRNNTTYDERVRFDVYYVRNWSIWLDLYILLRTIWVVLKRDGAY